MTIVNRTPIVNWEMDLTGPVPMQWFIVEATNEDVPLARPETIVCELSYPSIEDTVLLTVGNGITLATYESVSSSLVITIPTTEQLSIFTVGMQINAEWREGTPEQVIMRGLLNLV